MPVLRISFALLILTLALVPVSHAEDGLSGCVSCHTDEARIKALYTPTEAPPSEGEG